MKTILFFTLTLAASSWGPVTGQGELESPADLSLEVRTQNSQTEFQMGEIIPIELAFRSSSPNKYDLYLSSYDRSGRMSFERFSVDPQGSWADPLASYFGSLMGYIGGGPGALFPLSGTPATMELQLNEWIRFDAPGRYRVSIVSTRASEASSGARVAVTSNDLELTIVAARPEWQAATLQQALDTIGLLESAGDTQGPILTAAVLDAVKKLRYLGTPNAAREMAVRLRGHDWDWDFMFGLIASPAVSVGVLEMERLLADPDFPVTPQFLFALSIAALSGRNAAPASDDRTERIVLENRYREELAGYLESKRGAAYSASINTLNVP